ncbi:MAG: ABC transporter substrate-binding protein [Alphaproteobacteria bacterium]|nr:ABC transporter substrate-binding protein [Alphaproteobacteria bacterium]
MGRFCAGVLFIFFAWLTATAAFAQDRVVLQLRWDHQAQFAGYYAALWQGFYADAGLDVEIRSAFGPDGLVRAVTEVSEGRAQFGIGGADVLVAIDSGAGLKIATTIFQQSGFGIVALERSGISAPADLVGRRVGVRPMSVTTAELEAVLTAEGIVLDQIEWVQVEPGREDQLLIAGNIDAYMGFRSAGRWRLLDAGVIPIFLPASTYGVDFYGDVIFTTSDMVDQDPLLVRRFVEASRAGWEYALAHPQEIATRIATDLVRTVPVSDLAAFNQSMATDIGGLMLFPAVQLGHSNPARWEKMFDALAKAELVTGQFEYLEFVFDPDLQKAESQKAILKWSAFALVFFGIAGAGTTVIMWSSVMRRRVEAKTKELVERDQELAKSEKRFALAVEGTVAGIWDWDIKTGSSYFSPRWGEILGYSDGDLPPQVDTFFDLLHEDDIDRANEAIRAHLEDHKRFDINFRLRCKDRGYAWIHSRGQAVWDKNGNAIHMAGSIIDVSERVKAAEALAAASGRLTAIIEQAGEAIITIDEDQKIQVFNHAAESLFGVTEAEAKLMELTDLIPERHRPSHRAHVQNFIGSSETQKTMSVPGGISGIRKDGSEFPADATISSFSADGKRLGTVMIRDITDRRQWEADLSSAKNRAEFANKAKTQFLANTSHELRTPMNAIIGFTELLMAGIPNTPAPGQADYFSDIHQSALHLLDVIDDILDLSKIESEIVDLVEAELVIADLIHAAMRILAERARRENLTITTNIPADLPNLVADQRMVKQILINLLSNSVKFTKPGGTITIGANMGTDGSMDLWVADTGIGMAKDDIAKAISAFGQIDGDFAHKDEGTGLGLSLVNSQIDAHGGKLLVTSAVGVGTTVTTRFPAHRTVGGSQFDVAPTPPANGATKL